MKRLNKTQQLSLAKRTIKKDWYIQGFNARPLFLNHGAYSGLILKDELGYGYSTFTFNYQDDYGEMGYLSADFKKIWQEVKKKLARNVNYLSEVKIKYDQKFKSFSPTFAEVLTLKAKKVDQRELLKIFKICCAAQTAAVGMAHIVDAIGIEAEKEFKVLLFKDLKDKSEFNKYFNFLTRPTALSFLAKEELELRPLKNLKPRQRHQALLKHQRQYFWILNSYAKPVWPTLNFFQKRLKALSTQKFKDKPELNNILKIKLNPKTKQLQKIIDFTTIWQDQRKANALQAIGYLGLTVRIISSVINVPEKLLYNLSLADLSKIKDIFELKELKSELIQRSKGVYFIFKKGQEHVYIGHQYREIASFLKKINSQKEIGGDLHGSVANPGTVIGRAVICKGLNSLKNVKKGDVVVASMTRPEFMSALKKAAAIVTDEGGVTCHAAIISRELGIPCVVGTKVATKIIREGNTLEVRGNHGLVRIIK